MATLVELQAVPNRILQLVKQRILANRAKAQQRQERADTFGARPRAQRQRFGSRDEAYRPPEPAATGSLRPGYFLTLAGWWYGRGLYGGDPPEWASDGTQVMKPQRVTIKGADGVTSYTRFSDFSGGSVSYVLNGTPFPLEPDGYPLLTGNEAIDFEPFVATLSSYRKATQPPSLGSDEFDPAKFIFFSFKQPPCATGSAIHYKLYYNVYVEDTEPLELSHAYQTTHAYGKQTAAFFRSNDFTGSDKPLTEVGHSHLVASYVYADKIVFPAGGEEAHLFLDSVTDRNGMETATVTNVLALFPVGDGVWLYTWMLIEAAGRLNQVYTVTSVSSGAFSYINDIGNTVVHSGVRLVLTPSAGNTGVNTYTVSFLAIATHYFENLNKIKEDIAGDKKYTFYEGSYQLSSGPINTSDNDTGDDIGGGSTNTYNQWIRQNTSGGVTAPPQPTAGWVGYSDIIGAFVECSKAGKAYIVYGSYDEKDDPVYLPEVTSPHDVGAYEELIALRPYNVPNESNPQRPVTTSIRIKFLSLDCKTNTILQETGYQVVDVEAGESQGEAIAKNVPSWFPSKRYRDAGYMGWLRLDELERYNVYPSYQNNRYILVRVPLPQFLGIEAVVAELQDPTLPQVLEPMPVSLDVDALQDIAWGVGGRYDPRSPPRPSRYGYFYSAATYVAE